MCLNHIDPFVEMSHEENVSDCVRIQWIDQYTCTYVIKYMYIYINRFWQVQLLHIHVRTCYYILHVSLYFHWLHVQCTLWIKQMYYIIIHTLHREWSTQNIECTTHYCYHIQMVEWQAIVPFRKLYDLQCIYNVGWILLWSSIHPILYNYVHIT